MSENVDAAAVIGLGSMGWGAAVSLLGAGIAVHGVDLRQEVLTDLEAEGGIAQPNPAAAAREAGAVLVFVVNAAQTESVLFGDSGAVAAARPGTVFLTCATTPPSFAADIARRLTDAGMLAIDAPVSGGSAKALSGEITVMGAGTDAAFVKAGPVLDAIAGKVYRLGSEPGIGSQVKMINQLLAGVHIAATAEALTFGIRSGLDPKTLYDVICDSAGSSWMFQNRGPHIITGDYAAHSAVDIFIKDLGIVTTEGRSADFPLPLAETALALFRAAREAGSGGADDAAVAKVYAARGNVTLPGQD